MPFETGKPAPQREEIQDQRASLMVEKNDLVILVREIAKMQREILTKLRETGNRIAEEYGLPRGIDNFLEDRSRDSEPYDEKGFQSQSERAEKTANVLTNDPEFVAIVREYFAKLKEEQSYSDRYETGLSDFNRLLIEKDREEGNAGEDSLFSTKRLHQDANLRNVSLKYLADNDFERHVIHIIQSSLS